MLTCSLQYIPSEHVHVMFNQKIQPKSSFSYPQQSSIIQSAPFSPLLNSSFTNQRTNPDTPRVQIFRCLTEF